MTLAALLEELKAVDLETWESLRRYPIYINDGQSVTIDIMVSSNDTIVNDAVQGCIQRACERREWHWTIMKDPYQDGYRAEIAVVSESHLSDHICIDDLAIKCVTSPAEPLLAAYIAAVRGEAK